MKPIVFKIGQWIFDVNEPPLRVMTLKRFFFVMKIERNGTKARYLLRNRHKTKWSEWREVAA